MIQLDTKLDVPLLPDLARAFGQFGVFLVCPVSGTNDLADIGGSSEGMGQRPRIEQDDIVPALPQFDRSNDAINSRANHDRLHAKKEFCPRKTRNDRTMDIPVCAPGGRLSAVPQRVLNPLGTQTESLCSLSQVHGSRYNRVGLLFPASFGCS